MPGDALQEPLQAVAMSAGPAESQQVRVERNYCPEADLGDARTHSCRLRSINSGLNRSPMTYSG